MRDRLIELLDIIIQPGEKTLGDIADHLIANGVIVPPVKAGDVAFFVKDGAIYDGVVRDVIWNHNKNTGVRSEIGINTDPYYFVIYSFNAFGKTVFLTREDAEKALKGGAE